MTSMLASFRLFWGQTLPPAPVLMEKNLPDQNGKVFVVTGGTAGVGKALGEILYSHNAKIKSSFALSKGSLAFLHLDLNDLSTIKKSAQDFLSKEQRLDVLWNNAGVMQPPAGSASKQGYELQLGTNTLGPFLFTQLLTPVLIQTAKQAKLGSVRVLWVSSSATELMSPLGGVNMENLDYKQDKSPAHKYAVSKAGNLLHAQQYARLHKSDGVCSLSCNPGNLKTELQRHLAGWFAYILGFLSHEPIFGAYTELFAGLSPDITIEQSGCWIIPWGRVAPIRSDLADAGKTIAEGGAGIGQEFWAWSEEQVRLYM